MYNEALKLKVLSFINKGGSKVEAATRFEISRQTLYRWLNQPDDYQPKPGRVASYKFDQEQLRQDVLNNPKALLKELAAARGVSICAIHSALKRMGVVRSRV